MQKELAELFEQSTEAAMESARKAGALNLRVFEQAFRQQAEIATFWADVGARSLDAFLKTKGTQDLLAAQSSLLRECSEQSLESVRRGVTLMRESAEDYANLFQDNLRAAQAHTRRAAGLAVDATAA